MTVHIKMFDNKEKKKEDTLHRIFVGWEGGYFLTSLHNPQFHQQLQKMVADLGEPTAIEYRDQKSGWHKE